MHQVRAKQQMSSQSSPNLIILYEYRYGMDEVTMRLCLRALCIRGGHAANLLGDGLTTLGVIGRGMRNVGSEKGVTKAE